MKRKAGFGLLAIAMAGPLVMHFEGIELRTYKDPVGIPTVCIGETDKELVLHDKFTNPQCTAVLGASMAEHAQGMAECIDKPLASKEAAAVISWSYNIGVSAACGSTLVKKINAGASPAEWCPELKKWVNAGGKKLNGLVSRRNAEYSMCMTGAWA